MDLYYIMIYLPILYGYIIYIYIIKNFTKLYKKDNILLVSLEGNIGSGKSTLINILKTSISCVIVEEPIDLWIKMGIFELYCKDPIKNSYLFQSTVLWTRMKKIQEGIREAIKKGIKLVIIERSGIADYKCFIKTMMDLNQLTIIEYNSINLLYNYILEKYNILNNGKFIYLNTSPKVCQKRIYQRNRDGETISLNYLEMLDKRHKNDLIDYIGLENICTIEGNENYIYDKNKLKNVIETIKNFIFSNQ